MSKKLEGKVAVVTGASKGIGARIALQMAAEGASVVVNYSSSKEGADKVVKAVTLNGGKAIAVQANIAKQAEVKRLFEETKKAYGKVDILVNNAGVYQFAPLAEFTEEQFRWMFDLNVMGLLFASQEAARQFGTAGGSIINISSVAATSAPPTASVYSATKAAVNAITKSLAAELGPQKIRVNAINPGMVETEGVHTAGFAESEFRTQRSHKHHWAASGSRKTSLQPQSSWHRKTQAGSREKRCTSLGVIDRPLAENGRNRSEGTPVVGVPTLFH